MAIYISIKKIEEDHISVVYEFSLTNGNPGRFKISKGTWDTTLLEPLPNDTDSRMFARAAHKIRKHLKKGEIPETTCWAS